MTNDMTTNEQAGGRKKPSRHSVKRRYYKGGAAYKQLTALVTERKDPRVDLYNAACRYAQIIQEDSLNYEATMRAADGLEQAAIEFTDATLAESRKEGR